MGSSSGVGGLVGFLNQGTIIRSYSSGKVSSNSTDNIGGLIGEISSTNTIVDSSYWDIETSDQNNYMSPNEFEDKMLLKEIAI